MPELVVDCDPGLDDALVLLALAGLPELELTCVTAVAGNAPVELTARNAAFVLEHTSALQGTPVFAGAPGVSAAAPRHGTDGLGGLTGDAPAAWSPGGVAALARSGATILATGPLTNVAAALGGADGRRRVVVMGGRLGGAREFNFGFDPDAAARVLASGLAVTLVPIDITEQVAFARAEVDAIRRTAANPLVGALLDASLARAGGERCPVHDAVALLVLAHPELMRTTRGHVAVLADGRVRLAEDPAGPTEVVVEVDAVAVAGRLAELLRLC